MTTDFVLAALYGLAFILLASGTAHIVFRAYFHQKLEYQRKLTGLLQVGKLGKDY